MRSRSFTPDGKFMIVRAQRRAGFESDRSYLDVYDTSDGDEADRVRGARSFGQRLHAVERRQTIYFTASSKGTDNLYSVPLAGGTPVELQHGGSIGGLTLGESTVAFTRSSLTSPPDLWSMRLGGGSRNHTPAHARE